MSENPTGTRDNPYPMAKAFGKMIRFMSAEETEAGTYYQSPDVEGYFFQPRDTTFTRAQEKRIVELIDAAFARAMRNG